MEPHQYRNIALVGHGGSGKDLSLAEGAFKRSDQSPRKVQDKLDPGLPRSQGEAVIAGLGLSI